MKDTCISCKLKRASLVHIFSYCKYFETDSVFLKFGKLPQPVMLIISPNNRHFNENGDVAIGWTLHPASLTLKSINGWSLHPNISHSEINQWLKPTSQHLPLWNQSMHWYCYWLNPTSQHLPLWNQSMAEAYIPISPTLKSINVLELLFWLNPTSQQLPLWNQSMAEAYIPTSPTMTAINALMLLLDEPCIPTSPTLKAINATLKCWTGHFGVLNSAHLVLNLLNQHEGCGVYALWGIESGAFKCWI
jgi:hypothetical protein